MNITDNIKYRSRVATIRKEFRSLIHTKLKDRPIYISDHAIQRMAERDLDKDVPFVVGACRYFINEVFDKVTYESRDYKIKFRGLVIALSIETRKINEKIGRQVVLKTVFAHDTDFSVDEVITLK